VNVPVAYLLPIDAEREMGSATCRVTVPCS
jgi:hypothetical protein